MNDIRIFIASSYDTAHERAVVGDAVRRLNDRYEPQGWRIRLHCWEDYEPTYRGLRKQSEYNEDLIKTSHLFIALFRDNCGQFTQEEIHLWTDNIHRMPVVLDIQDPAVNKANVNTYLASQCLTPIAVTGDSDIYAQVETLVANHIATHPAGLTAAHPIAAKELYATIPDDRATERAPFGNLVRSVDDLAERAFHSRCRLTTGNATKIPTSDYYAAILKDTVSPDGLLLVDELSNGFHFSVMPSLWQVVAYAARKNNTQVFATTHDIDSMKGLRTMALSQPQAEKLPVSAYKLQRDSQGVLTPYRYSVESMDYAFVTTHPTSKTSCQTRRY